jgi:uncharacterized membrane protein HdeD (DUF308 family)
VKTLEKDRKEDRFRAIRPEAPPPIYTRDFFHSQRPKKDRITLINIGVMEVLLGALAVVLPFIPVLNFGIALGAVILVTGAMQLMAAVKSRSFVKVLIGMVPLAAGVLALANTSPGPAYLPTLFTVYLLFSGIFRFVFALRSAVVPRRTPVLLGALYATALAALIMYDWPGNTAGAMGLFIGTNIVFSGALTVVFADQGKLMP